MSVINRLDVLDAAAKDGHHNARLFLRSDVSSISRIARASVEYRESARVYLAGLANGDECEPLYDAMEEAEAAMFAAIDAENGTP